MTLAFGQLFARDLTESDLRRGLLAVWGHEGYVPFDACRIPAGYLAYAGEIVRVASSGAGDEYLRAILIEDWYRTFARALALSRQWPGKDVVAVVHPPLAATRVKVYRDGGIVLKVGEDPDEEVPYCPAVSTDEDVSRFLRAWRPEAQPDAGILAALAGIRRDCSYPEAMDGAWPFPLREWVYIDRRSRLYAES